jgi:MFS family permease
MTGLGGRYRKVWTAAAQSNLADGIFKVALPVLAVSYTDSPALVAGVAFAGSLPWLLFGLHAGAIVDRLDRRRAMRNANLFRSGAVVVLALAVLTGLGSLPLLYAVALALGVTETLHDTSAQSIIPGVVNRSQLSRANGRLYAAEVTANGFLGPPLGGLLAGVSIAAAFAVSGSAYLGAAIALTLFVGDYRPHRATRTSLMSDIREGVSYLARDRLLRTLALIAGATNMYWFAWQSVLVLYALAPGPMGLSEFGYGLLLMSGAAGSVAGSFFVGPAERLVGRGRLLCLCLVGWSLWLAGPALSSNPWVVGGLMVTGSVTGIWWNIISISLRQRIVPDQMLGRVNAAYRVLSWGAMPVGAALGGVLGQVVGLQPLFAVTALGTLALLIPMLPIISDARLRDQPVTDDPMGEYGADRARR